MKTVEQRILRLILLILTVLTLVSAQDRFPRPEFESDYNKPETLLALPDSVWYEILDVAVLIIALSIAAFFVLRRRSRNLIFLLSLFSLAYFGFWRKGCICPVGSIQNVTLSFFDATYLIPVGVILFFILPLLFALFFGRVFCAAVCPLGAVQDAVLIKPRPVPPRLAAVLSIIPYVFIGAAILYSATGSGHIICQLDPFVSFFRLSGEPLMLVYGSLFLLIGVFYGRPYCRFLCPYGVLLNWFSKFSRWHLSITPDRCTQCHLCQDACPYDAIDKPAPPLDATDRRQAGRRLGKLIVLTIGLAVAGGISGYFLYEQLSSLHPTIRLTEQVLAEKQGLIRETTLASQTFHESGQTVASLLEETALINNRFRTGSTLLGIFIGLVIGIKSIGVFFRGRREDYEANRGECFSCGRCLPYCPEEHERQAVLNSKEGLYESIG
ncbi:MAG: 4Fe-4S binding protein [Candidatus Marinimicrobia bacterium]|nr:4Fe-4S binding protein [Candidatus Neomarinimicrobiota bacterium]